MEVGEDGRAFQFEEEYGELEVAIEEEFHRNIPEVPDLADSAAKHFV